MGATFNQGQQAAVSGKFRASPFKSSLEFASCAEWLSNNKEWYAGYDSATRKNSNPNLNEKFSLRVESPFLSASI